MPLPPGYLEALETLAEVFEAYHRRTGDYPVLVGGAAVSLLTDGAFPSSDFDIVAPASPVFDEELLKAGFVPERAPGLLHIGFCHPDHPQYGFQQVSGALFDGQSDRKRLIFAVLSTGNRIVLPSVET